MGSPISQRDFPALDGIRGLAAILVVAWHMPPSLLPAGPASSYLAVDLFFCLSGFVIARAFGARLRDGLNPRRFLMLRLIRLYPVYLVAIGIGALAAWLDVRADASAAEWEAFGRAVVLALLFLPMVGDGLGATGFLFPLCPPTWSLALELAVNAVYGFTARRLRAARLVAVLGAAAGLLAAAAFAWWSLDIGYQWANAAGGLPRVAFAFTAGVVLDRLALRTRAPIRNGTAIAVLVTAAVLWLPVPGVVRPLFDLAVVVAVFPAIILIGSNAAVSARAAGLSRIAGELSYPIYLFHVPVIGMVDRLQPGPLAGSALVAVILAALAAAAVAVVERPVRQSLRSRMVGPQLSRA